MITQKFIYEAAQRAFGEHHRKFPWPKKHELEDQSDQFKKAFLVLCTDINAEHEAEKSRIVSDRDQFSELAATRYKTIVALRDKIESKNTKLAFAWLIIGVLIGGALIWYMNQPADCMNFEEMKQGDVYVGFAEVNGKTVAMPVCN